MVTKPKIEAAADKLRVLVAVCGDAQDGAPLRRAAGLVGDLNRISGDAHVQLQAPVPPQYMGMARSFSARVLASVRATLANAIEGLDRLKPEEISVPPRQNFIEELEQAVRDFSDINFSSGQISVRTEPITLEHEGIKVNLGRFDLVLGYPKRLDPKEKRALNLRIDAVDPNPAFRHDTITHPHVRDGGLCEGEAAAALRYALNDGRLADVFEIVDRTLHTYNPASPYVQLEKWTAITCPICGKQSIETAVCSDCDQQVCAECTTTCGECGNRACKECIGACKCCGDIQVCDNCAFRCTTAGCEHHERICGHCTSRCVVCNSVLCCHCQRRCKLCGAAVCATHGIQAAGDDGLFTCPECNGPDPMLKASRAEYPEEGGDSDG